MEWTGHILLVRTLEPRGEGRKEERGEEIAAHTQHMGFMRFPMFVQAGRKQQKHGQQAATHSYSLLPSPLDINGRGWKRNNLSSHLLTRTQPLQ